MSFVRLDHFASPSLLSQVAAAFYFAVSAACLSAARSGWISMDGKRSVRFWLAATAIFMLLAIMRLLETEDSLRSSLRNLLAMHGATESRQLIQLPLSVFAVFAAAVMLAIFWRSWRATAGEQFGVMLLSAKLAILGMTTLVGLRIISLHAMDAILFSGLVGPIRLNWILDLGFSATVLVSAISFAWTVHTRE